MNHEKAIYFIENSFLKPLLSDSNITDISFNGKDLFYQHNLFGRRHSNITLCYEQAYDFVRQLANLCEKSFSIAEPILDINISRYRINAVHPYIAKLCNIKAIHFSIRIARSELRINNDNHFFPKKIDNFIQKLLNAKQSIVIAGLTGSGKTELQKYILSKLDEKSRVIVIDNILELNQTSFLSSCDINFWQCDERFQKMDTASLIRNALRCNPDWLIIAEARGAEMIDVLNSALTGTPIITTLHSKSADTIVSRMVSMIKMNDKKMDDNHIISDIYSHIHFYFYVSKMCDKKGNIVRRLTNIIFVNNYGLKFEIYNYFKHKNEVIINDSIVNLLKGIKK